MPTFFRLRSLFCLLFLLLSAQLVASEHEDAISELIEKSGLADQIRAIPLSMKEGMVMAQSQGSPIPEPAFQAILSSVDRSFVADDMLEALQVSLDAALEPAQLDELLDWYNSPIGIEITEAEKAGGDTQAHQEMLLQAKELFGDTRRVKFAEKLDKLFGATDMVMELQQYTGMAVFSAIMIANQPDVAVDLSRFNEQLAQQLEASRPAVQQGIVLSLLYSYKDVDMAKLDDYSQFLTQPTTRKFNGVVMDSLNQSLQMGIEDFAQNLARLLGSNLQQS